MTAPGTLKGKGSDGGLLDVPIYVPGRQPVADSKPMGLSAEDFAAVGAPNEAAPAADTTANVGLNGRLQRVAQRLTSLIAQVPATLGIKAAAASLSVVHATEDAAAIGAINEAAPAADTTANVGLNGRLQRIAQRLTSLIALFPAGLGRLAAALSLSVTLSNEDKAALDNLVSSSTDTLTPSPVAGLPSIVYQALANVTTAGTLYATGDAIGGLQTLANFVRGNGFSTTIVGAGLRCKANQSFLFDMVFFHTNPAASTFTDNAAAIIAAADFDKVATTLSFVATDWSTFNPASIAQKTELLRKIKAAAGSRDIYVGLVARGAFTLAANADLTLAVKGEND